MRKKSNHIYEKKSNKLIFSLFSFIIFVFFIKFFLNLEIKSIKNSKEIELLIFNSINSNIEKLANHDLSQVDKKFYKENFSKLKIKFKELLDTN